MDYTKINKLFNIIENVDDLRNISGKENVVIIPTHGKYGKSITVISQGAVVESYYLCDYMLKEVFPSREITKKHGRLEVLKQLGFNPMNILTVKASFLKSIDRHHIGTHRCIYSKKNILIPESEIDRIICSLYGKVGGKKLWTIVTDQILD